MKFNKKTAIEAAKTVGGATVGFVGVHAATKALEGKIPAKLTKFVGIGEVAAGGAAVVLSKNTAIKAVGIGVAVHGIVKTVNAITAPSVDENGMVTPATGAKAMIAAHMPALNGHGASYLGTVDILDSYPQYSESHLLGNTSAYNDSSSYTKSASELLS